MGKTWNQCFVAMCMEWKRCELGLWSGTSLLSLIHGLMLLCDFSSGLVLKSNGPALCARVSIGLDLGWDV